MTSGMEWIIDARGCLPAPLASLDTLRALCESVVRQLELHVVGQPQWHVFPPPGGVTGLYLLSESHLACHTFPEWGLATFNLYCCRPRADWPWGPHLRAALHAQEVVVRVLPRGLAASERVPLAAEGGALPAAGVAAERARIASRANCGEVAP